MPLTFDAAALASKRLFSLAGGLYSDSRNCLSGHCFVMHNPSIGC